ncbi:MAG: hypothetical protein ACRC6X_02815 [Culicoidibacterales bacterium]
MKLFKFECLRFIRQKNIIFAVILFFALFMFTFFLQSTFYNAVDGNNGIFILNIYKGLSQFSMFLFAPITANSFAKDYEDKTIVYYYQRSVSGLSYYWIKVSVYLMFICTVYSIYMVALMFFFPIATGLYLQVYVLLLFIIIYSVAVGLMSSFLFRRKISAIIFTFFFWFFIATVNANVNLPFPGMYTIIDTNSYTNTFVHTLFTQKSPSFHATPSIIEHVSFNTSLAISVIWSGMPLVFGSLFSWRWMKNAV